MLTKESNEFIKELKPKNNKNETHIIKYLGLKDPLSGKRSFIR